MNRNKDGVQYLLKTSLHNQLMYICPFVEFFVDILRSSKDKDPFMTPKVGFQSLTQPLTLTFAFLRGLRLTSEIGGCHCVSLS